MSDALIRYVDAMRRRRRHRDGPVEPVARIRPSDEV